MSLLKQFQNIEKPERKRHEKMVGIDEDLVRKFIEKVKHDD